MSTPLFKKWVEKVSTGKILQSMGRPRTRERTAYGNHLKALRIRKLLSQQEVALELHQLTNGEFSNTNTGTISRWEIDGQIPPSDLLIPLCKIYGVTLEILLCVYKKRSGIYMRAQPLEPVLPTTNEYIKSHLERHEAKSQQLINNANSQCPRLAPNPERSPPSTPSPSTKPRQQ